MTGRRRGGFWRDFYFWASFHIFCGILPIFFFTPLPHGLTDDLRPEETEAPIRDSYPIQNAIAFDAGWNDPSMDDYNRLTVLGDAVTDDDDACDTTLAQYQQITFTAKTQ